MVERVRVNWKLLTVVLSIVGAPVMIIVGFIAWWWNSGPTFMYMSAPKAFDRFFEKAEISELSGGGITWLDPVIDIRFKSEKPVALKAQNEYKPGGAIIRITDDLLATYPDDAASFLDSNELEFWSKRSNNDLKNFCVYNKRTKVCYFHYED